MAKKTPGLTGRSYDPIADGQKERTKSDTHRLNINIPKSLYESLRRQAFEQNTTITKVIVNCLEDRPTED